MSTSLGEVFVEIVGDADPLAADLSNALGDIGDTISSELSGAFDGVTDGLADDFSAAGNEAGGALVDGVEAEVGSLDIDTGGAFDGMTAEAESAADGVGAAFDGVGDQIESSLAGAFDGITDKLGSLQGALGTAAGGAGLEGFARAQLPLTEQSRRLAEGLGLTEDRVRELALASSDVTRPLDQVLNTMEVGRQQGLKNEEQLMTFVAAWDTVGDATGLAADELAKLSPSLAAVGIEAHEVEDAFGAFGYITENTTMDVGEFLNIINRMGPELRDMNLDVDDTAAVLGAMQGELGLTGRVARQQFRKAVNEADGDMGKMLETLGLSEEQFASYRGEVDASGDIIARNADIHADSYTLMQRGQHVLSDLMFRFGGVAEAASLVAAPLGALGPLMFGANQASQLLGGGLGGKLMGGIKAAVGGFKTLATAMLTSPIFWVIAGIAALVAAFVWAWNNIDGFADFFIGIWERIKDMAGAVVDWFQNTAMPAFAAVWDIVVTAATAAWEAIQAAVSAVVDWFTAHVLPVLQGIGDAVAAGWALLGDVAAAVWGAIRDAVSAVVDWFTGTMWPALQTVGDAIVTAWETLRDVAATVWGAVKDAVGAVVDWFRDHVGPVIDAVGDLIGAVFGRVGEEGGKLSDILSAVFGFLADGWQTFMDILRTVWDAVGQPMLDAVKAGFEFARDVLLAVWDAITAAAQFAWDLLVGIWNSVGEPLLEAVKTGFQIMGDYIATVWEIIRTVIETILGVIAGIIAAITAAIRGDWEGVWTAILGIASTIWEGIKGVVTAAITFVQTTIARVLGAISALWSGIWTAIRTTASTIWSAIRQLVSTAISAVLATIRRILTTIRDVWRSMWNTVRNLVRTAWTNIRTAVRTGASNMMSIITGLPRRILSAVRNFGTLLLQAGRNLLNGLIRGIRERISAIGDVISDAASAVTRFWPFSPAKEGPLRTHAPEDAGANIMRLIAGGMSDNVDEIAAQARAAAEAALVDIGVSRVSLPELTGRGDGVRSIRPSEVEDAVRRRSERSGSGMTVTQNIYTTDPQKAATASIRKLRDAAYLGGDLALSGREVNRDRR